jgi:isoquinoline 1-oxidoreductase subunit beta
MRRRTFLVAGGLVALIGASVGVWRHIPVIPKRPEPDAKSALGWIAHRNGRFTLTLPRAEMGQNIATALKQVACAELDADWSVVDVVLHDTRLPLIKATVGSESVMRYTEPLAQACAAIRDALASGRSSGPVEVVPRPIAELRAFRAGGYIGATPEIVQGREIVMGTALYAADVRRDSMVYGRVLRAPASVELGSKPKRWNLKAVSDIPGFIAVVEDCGPPIGQAYGIGIVASRLGALDPIAAALAVEWDVDTSVDDQEIATEIDVDTHLPSGPLAKTVLKGEPVEGGWDVNVRLDIPLAAHAPIEPRAAVAEWKASVLSIWTGTQDAFYVRDVLAHSFGLRGDDVTVHSRRIGGAFGGKTICTVEAEAAALSRAVGRPVKVQWTRAQEFALGFHRPPSSHRVKARMKSGRITDWDHAKVSSHILFTAAVVPAWMQRGTDLFAGDGGIARGLAAPYVLGRARSAYTAVRLPVHTGPWRGLGAGPNSLAIESAIDEAAVKAKADGVSFRLSHIGDKRLARILKRVAEFAKWGDPATPIEGSRTGRGVGCGIYKEQSYAAAVADVAVDPLGNVRVTKLWCVHDCGLIINPDQVKAQCEGNLVWSIGLVLSDTLPVEGGRVTAEVFSDAPIPRISDVPPIEVDLIDSNLPPTAAGETAMVAGPGAIANAIRAATGIRPTRFPIQPSDFVAR